MTALLMKNPIFSHLQVSTKQNMKNVMISFFKNKNINSFCFKQIVYVKI